MSILTMSRWRFGNLAVAIMVFIFLASEVLADKDGWYQIRLADGSSAGWIFGQFLDNQRPG